MLPAVRLRTLLRSQVRTANEANANEAASAGANLSAKPAAPPGPSLGERVGAWRRRVERDRSRWARRALDWPLVNWLEATVWVLVALTLAASFYGSYGNLVGVLMAVGYAFGPAHVVPVVLDAPLTASVIGQFLLARWKSPTLRRWRLFAVTLVTAPLSLAGNALHGALVYADGDVAPQLDLSLLDLYRTDVWIRLVAAMVPAIGIILAVAVTELVLRERARLEELRENAGASEGETEPEREPDSQDDSQPPPPRPPRNGAKIDPRVLRIARAGGTWREVEAKTGLTEHAAKRELTAARKRIASEAQADGGSNGPGETGREVAA